MAAAMGGHVGLVRLLAGAGAAVDTVSGYGATALTLALAWNFPETLDWLLRCGASPNVGWPLHEACKQNQPGMAQLLLTARADVQLGKSERDDYNKRLQADKGYTELVGRGVQLHSLVKRPDLNGRKGTIISLIASGRLKVRLQGAAEAPLALRLDNLLLGSDENVTPLLYAARGGHLQMLKLMLSAGADINHQTNLGGRSALALAVTVGHIPVVECLLKNGASTLLRNQATMSEVKADARAAGHLRCVELLEEACDREVEREAEGAERREVSQLRERRMQCAHCGQTANEAGVPALRSCAGCRLVAYCCTEHQRAHWKSAHKKSCESNQARRSPAPAGDTGCLLVYTSLQWSKLKKLSDAGEHIWFNLQRCRLYLPSRPGDPDRVLRISSITRAAMNDKRESLRPHLFAEDPDLTCYFLQLQFCITERDAAGRAVSPSVSIDRRGQVTDLLEAKGWVLLEACNMRAAFVDAPSASSRTFRVDAQAAADSVGVALELADRRVDPGTSLIVDFPELSD